MFEKFFRNRVICSGGREEGLQPSCRGSAGCAGVETRSAMVRRRSESSLVPSVPGNGLADDAVSVAAGAEDVGSEGADPPDAFPVEPTLAAL